MKKRFNGILSIILVVLILIILGIVGYLLYEHYQKSAIQQETSEVLEQFDSLIIELNENNGGTENNENGDSNQENNVSTGMGGIKTNSLYLRGYKVVGKIEMPSVNLQYPILDVLTDAKALDHSVAIQYGVGLNKIGNTIIMGHNYRSGAFFGSNKKMKIGDSIYITDLDGNRIEYKIYNKYITAQEDFSYANRNTQGKKEITLVTCDSNNKNRLIIYAREI